MVGCKKVPARFRTTLFALVMSASTALIVSGIIIAIHSPPGTPFVTRWLTAFLTAWPIVFVAILIIAPLVNKLLDLCVEKN